VHYWLRDYGLGVSHPCHDVSLLRFLSGGKFPNAKGTLPVRIDLPNYILVNPSFCSMICSSNTSIRKLTIFVVVDLAIMVGFEHFEMSVFY
jgi:hypothetical protein